MKSKNIRVNKANTIALIPAFDLKPNFVYLTEDGQNIILCTGLGTVEHAGGKMDIGFPEILTRIPLIEFGEL